MEKLTIGKMAKMANVGVETIRFYQRKGIIRIPGQVSGIRTYSYDDVQRVQFIKKVQELGFSLIEIKELLELNQKSRQTCTVVKTKAQSKIEEIERKITNLMQMKEGLQKLTHACDSSQDQVKQYKVQECFNLDSESLLREFS